MFYDTLTEEQKRKQIEGNVDSNFQGVDFLNVNMFVEAGAGAGKTSLIVKRIVNQLKNGDAPSAFVVITFTNKAAEELRGRIYKEVKKAGLNDTLAHLDEMNISTIHSFCNVLLKEQSIALGLPQNLTLMEETEARELQDKYFVDYLSTLNANDWDQLEKNKTQFETRRKIKEYILTLYRSIVDLSDDNSICNINTPKQGNLTKVTGFIKDAENQANEIAVEIVKAIYKVIKEPGTLKSFSDFYNFGMAEWVPYNIMVTQETWEMLKAYNEKEQGIISSDEYVDIFLKALFNAKSYMKKTGKYIDADGNEKSKSLSVKTYNVDNFDEASKTLQSFIDEKISVVRNLLDENGGKLCKTEDALDSISQISAAMGKEGHFITILDYAKKAKKYYHDNKPKNKVSNDNLIELTRQLICGTEEKNKKALEFYSKKYKHFYIDEFQDTDMVQKDFLYRLASDLSDETHTKLRDGALFVVGDPKQSIYRFRGAQPEVYFDVKEVMSDQTMTNAYVYELSNNFRTNEEVINWINEKFEDSDAYTPIINMEGQSYKPMTPVKQSYKDAAGNVPDNLIHGIYNLENSDAIYVSNTYEKENKKTGVKSIVNEYDYCEYENYRDVEDVVNLILNLKNGGYCITKYDEKIVDGVFTLIPKAVPIQFKDFLLISQNMTRMEMYLTALKKHGIPVAFDGKTDLSLIKVMNMYSRLYWYLVNPKDPLHRVGAWEAVRESGINMSEEDLDVYMDGLLDYLYANSKNMSAFGKAEYLEKQIAALLDKDRVYGFIEVYDIKTKLRQMIESIMSQVDGTGIQIATRIDKYIATNLDHELSLEEDADAVRFMNLHKSKGLEGEIVIMLDRKGPRSLKPKAGSIRSGNIYYPAIVTNGRFGQTAVWAASSGISSIISANEKESLAEFHRLEYVAVTRAKQAVIFMNTIHRNALFAYAGKDFYVGKEQPKVGYNYKLDEDANVKSIKDVIEKNNNAIKEPVSVGDYDLSADGYNESVGLTNESNEKVKGEYTKKNPSKLEKEYSKVRKESRAVNFKGADVEKLEEEFKRPSGNILGNCLHRAMELLVDRYDENLSSEDIAKVCDVCAIQAIRENEEDIPVLEDDDNVEIYLSYIKEAAKAYYSWLIENDIMKGAKGIYTELPFSYFDAEALDEEGEISPEWMNGTADLIIEYEDNITLIDYKSDNDFMVDEVSMHESFNEIYSPQVEVYKKIINKVFGSGKNVIAKIISFSLRDEFNMNKKLPGETLRVRSTTIEV